MDFLGSGRALEWEDMMLVVQCVHMSTAWQVGKLKVLFLEVLNMAFHSQVFLVDVTSSLETVRKIVMGSSFSNT